MGFKPADLVDRLERIFATKIQYLYQIPNRAAYSFLLFSPILIQDLIDLGLPDAHIESIELHGERWDTLVLSFNDIVHLYKNPPKDE